MDHFSQFTIVYGECSNPGSENVWANRKSKTGHRAISTRPPTGKQSVGVRRRGARSLSHIVTVTIGGICRLKYAGTKPHKRTPNAASYHKPWQNQHKEQQWLVSHSGNVGVGESIPKCHKYNCYPYRLMDGAKVTVSAVI